MKEKSESYLNCDLHGLVVYGGINGDKIPAISTYSSTLTYAMKRHSLEYPECRHFEIRPLTIPKNVDKVSKV